MYFITKDMTVISQGNYEVFQADLNDLLKQKQYDEIAVWSLACYKEKHKITFKELVKWYDSGCVPGRFTELVDLFNKVKGVASPETPRKPVTVRINVDLYYEIDTTYLPEWLAGDAIAKAVEMSFEDAGPPTFASLSSVLKQAPSEVIINKFVYDHEG